MATTIAPDRIDGLAELAYGLRIAARLPGLMVVVDGELDGNAYAAEKTCLPVPLVRIGAGLTLDSQMMAGVLAHEVAHCTDRSVWPGTASVTIWVTDRAALAATVAWAVAGLPVVWSLTLAVAAGVTRLWHAWLLRRGEYRADALSVTLLNQAGRDGAATVRATLDEVACRESRWDRVLWPLHSHPTASARIRNVRRRWR